MAQSGHEGRNRDAARKDDVIQIRASAGTKAILNRAAGLRGQKLSEFMLDSARRQAEEMIRQLGARLPSVDIQVGHLSGGQQQSVAIARALTFSPKVVIMDEPTAALAVREIQHVLDLIKELKGRGIAVILISHRLTDVFEVADRIVALRQGVVIADEPTAKTTMQKVVAHIVGAQ